jgi:hypothetical protein
MRLMILAALLFTMTVTGAKAQQYDLPNSGCAVQGTSYLYCSSMGIVTINDVRYNVFLSALNITNLYQNPESAPVVLGYGSFNLQNLTTGVYSTMAFLTATYTDRHLTFTFGPTVAPWNGQFSGTVDLDLVESVQNPPCGRYGCRTYWIAENVVLQVN